MYPHGWGPNGVLQPIFMFEISGMRLGTGEGWIIDVLVMAKGMTASISRSRFSIVRTWALGRKQSSPVVRSQAFVLAGIGVGVCSSVVPYVCDQLAMARLTRASFTLVLALLPAIATVIGALLLGQIPTLRDIAGIGLAIHKSAMSAVVGSNLET